MYHAFSFNCCSIRRCLQTRSTELKVSSRQVLDPSPPKPQPCGFRAGWGGGLGGVAVALPSQAPRMLPWNQSHWTFSSIKEKNTTKHWREVILTCNQRLQWPRQKSYNLSHHQSVLPKSFEEAGWCVLLQERAPKDAEGGARLEGGARACADLGPLRLEPRLLPGLLFWRRRTEGSDSLSHGAGAGI